MAHGKNNVIPINDYEYQKELYERNQKIYDANMRLWESFNQTAMQMDSRFDKTLFAVAAGSFGISFAFIIRSIQPLASGANDSMTPTLPRPQSRQYHHSLCHPRNKCS